MKRARPLITADERCERLKHLQTDVLMLTLKLPRGKISIKQYIERAQKLLDEMKLLSGM